jgi:NO-binding membrane sensor protein with MHYT domain
MGGVATWCMQLVGNGAIILGDGSLGVQISYSAGYTILSFILPIVVLFIAFTAVGINEDVSFIRLGLGGTLAGLGVCGMHYLGQASITNYECTYDILNVVGAALVAVVASCAALCMFFVFRSSWSSAWWKRALCAIILATAVTGMHWTASVGTAYRWKEGSPLSDGSSKNALTIVVIVLVRTS